MKKFLLISLIACVVQFQYLFAQNIGINATGSLPNSKAMLDVSSTTMGVLIPRMSSAERNAITSPPNGLEVYNHSLNSLEIYRGSSWAQVGYTDSMLVLVQTLADLPTPVSGAIVLVSAKTYCFRGGVNISPNYININGATLLGTSPSTDAILSTVAGGILRSTGASVFIQNLAVIPLSGASKAYDFADATGTKFCNLFSGCSVVEVGIPSLGVGQISGFKAITIASNYWKCADGIKITGAVGKFCSFLNFITDITSGSGIEFLSGLSIDDIDLSNNYFVYTGQTGIKVNAGATIDIGRMTTNMFRGVGALLTGFDSYSLGWSMQQNSGIPNSRAFSTIYMNDNSTATSLTTLGTYYKILGTTTALSTKRFVMTNNRLTYNGKKNTSARIFSVIGGKAPSNDTDYSIAIAKNGIIIPFPNSSMGSMVNNQGFQISLESEVDLVTGDYVEIFIKRNTSSGSSLVVSDLQFRISDF
ncbi:MAG: hypothetical protein H7X88_00310 [Gloeobacteraceae cyanobacterium ES-bin-316]|nr:hypothetical protein [Ferruginibacter sp.]